MAIDAHVHVWQMRSPHPVPLRERIAALAHDFTLDDLDAAWSGLGLSGCVLVEAGSTEAETESLLALQRARSDVVAGVVGWADIASPALASTLDRWSASGRLLGVRETVAFGERWAMIDSDAFDRGLDALAQRRLCFEIVVRPDQLDVACAIARRHPDLRLNVNHAGRPLVLCGRIDEWAHGIEQLAKLANTTCKLSGLIERAGFEWSPQTLAPYVTRVLDAFGAERTLFASNWPVMTVAGTYARWWDAVNAIVTARGASATDRERIFGGSASAFYRLQ